MFQKNTENCPKSTQNPIRMGPKMGPGNPWGSIVKLRSELYGFWVLFGVPLWPYFLTFFDVIFQHFPQPLFDTVLEELWCYFGSVLEAFFSSFWGTPEKVKIWLSLQREHCFQGFRGSRNTAFLDHFWMQVLSDLFVSLFVDFGSIFGSFWGTVGHLIFMTNFGRDLARTSHGLGTDLARRAFL